MAHREDLTISEALEIVLVAADAMEREDVPLADALGRTLVADVRARADHPNVDNSALDGYACRAVDTGSATAEEPVRLHVIGEVPAGRPFDGTVGPREAVAIYTGGAVPRGADAIVPVEATAREGDVVALSRPARREDIRPRGQDLRTGDVGLHRGRRLDAASLALAAGMGQASVPVARRPRVGILATGSELVPPGGTLQPGQVYDANATGIAALVQAAGGEPHLLPRIPDDPAIIAETIRKGPAFDLLLTSGGVSMGRYDLVRDLMFDHGDVAFWKVSMKPGGPTLFGRFAGMPLLGLPGNPVSSLVVFLVFGRAFLERSQGAAEPIPYQRRRGAVAGEDLSTKAKETFFRVVLDGDPVPTARSTGSQSSGILRSMALADALAVVPANARIRSGDAIEVIELAPLLR